MGVEIHRPVCLLQIGRIKQASKHLFVRLIPTCKVEVTLATDRPADEFRRPFNPSDYRQTSRPMNFDARSIPLTRDRQTDR